MSAGRVNELLQVADRLPAHLRTWLVQGLEAWQRGRELEQALELLPDQSEFLSDDERDAYIRTCIQSCPGGSIGAKCAFFTDVVNGVRRHPDKTGRQLVKILQRSRVYIPATRQLRRILQGRRQDGWCELSQTGLCHKPDVLDNRVMLQKTGTKP